MQTTKQKSHSEEDWNKRFRRARRIINILGIIIGAGFIIACIILASSCGNIKYVPVYQKDSIYITNRDTTVLRDSVYLRDSVFVESKGDTVFLNKYIYQYKYKDRYKAVHDTLYLDKYKDTTIIKEVEKPLTKLQKAEIGFGKIAFGFLLGFLVYLCWKLYKKFS